MCSMTLIMTTRSNLRSRAGSGGTLEQTTLAPLLRSDSASEGFGSTA